MRQPASVPQLLGCTLALPVSCPFLANPDVAGPIACRYALCGFANLGSLGIMVGGLSALAPSKREVLARNVLRAMVAGTLACFATACVAGALYQEAREAIAPRESGPNTGSMLLSGACGASLRTHLVPAPVRERDLRCADGSRDGRMRGTF